jgi:hypothetical protein
MFCGDTGRRTQKAGTTHGVTQGRKGARTQGAFFLGAGHVSGVISNMECVTRPDSNDTTTILRGGMDWRDHKGGSQVPCRLLYRM